MIKAEGREKIMPASLLSKRIRLFLIRHGQVLDHDPPRFNGHRDIGLSPEGREQLKQVANRIADQEIHEIYCSDLSRTVIGAEIIAGSRGITPVRMQEFREMDLGVFDGLTFTEVQEQYGDVFHDWRKDILHYRIPEGESFLELEKRVCRGFDRIMHQKEGNTLVIVAHGGVNRIILARALKMDLNDAFRIEQDYGCLNVIDYYPDWTVVKLVNMSF